MTMWRALRKLLPVSHRNSMKAPRDRVGKPKYILVCLPRSTVQWLFTKTYDKLSLRRHGYTWFQEYGHKVSDNSRGLVFTNHAYAQAETAFLAFAMDIF